MLIPKEIRNQLAITQGYIQKNNVPLALESLAKALPLVKEFCDNRSFFKSQGLEKNINTLLQRLRALPPLQTVLQGQEANKVEQLRYQQGKEGALATVLRELANILREQSQKTQESQQSQLRLQELLQKGQALLKNTEYERGNAFLERAAQEFYENSNVILHVADILMQYNQHHNAMKVLSQSLATHNKNEVHYLRAIEAALAVPNQAQVEHIYSLASQHLKPDSPMLLRLEQLKMLAICQ